MAGKQPNRLTRIVTRRGDKGKTSLGDGSSLPKNAPRIEAIGTIDELNSFIGVFISDVPEAPELANHFRAIQNDLFDLGGELAMPGHRIINKDHVIKLEKIAETLNKNLPPLENFILPGGSRAVALCHVVRSVARRAERRLISLANAEREEQTVNPHSRVYLNRLSDVCFISARWLAKASGEDEILWQPSIRVETD